MFQEYPDIVNIPQLCKMLSIGRSSAYSLLQGKLISHVRVGRKYIIPKSAVIGFVSQPCYNDSQIIKGRLQIVNKGEVI